MMRNRIRKVFLRADASKKIGYGHFFRTLALANMLKDNFDCTFFTASPTQFQKEEVKKTCKLVELKEETKFEDFLSFINGDEIVFLDNYFFNTDYQKEIKNKGCKLVTIGPNNKHYYADVLINTVTENPNEFSIEPFTKLLLGINWALLREPFHSAPGKKEKADKKHVMVCFGGTDQFFLTEKIVEVLLHKTSVEKISVLVTDDFEETRREKLFEKGVEIVLNANAQSIVELFNSSDLAILSSSSITIEALACGVQVITGYYVENQKMFYNYLVHNKLVTGVGDLLQNNMKEYIDNAIDKHIDLVSPLVSINFSDLKKRYISEFEQL